MRGRVSFAGWSIFVRGWGSEVERVWDLGLEPWDVLVW